MSHIIQKFLFRQRNHVEGLKTQINRFGSGNNGGSRANLGFYSSWSISNSLYEELSSVTLASNANPHPKPSLVNDVDAPLRWPTLMLPSIKEKITGNVVHRFFNPVNNDIIRIKTSMNSPLPKKFRCFWSSHGWLAFIDTSDCGLYLWDPSSNNPSKDVIRLPSIESLPCTLSVKRNGDGSIRRFTRQFIMPGHHLDFTPLQLASVMMRQLCFSIAPSLSMEKNDSIVMAIVHSGDLAICKPGGTEWTGLEGPLRTYLEVIPSSIDKVFYAKSRKVALEAWDLRDLSSIKRTVIDYKRDLPREKAVSNANCIHTDEFLVESSGDLFLVFRYVATCGVSGNCATVDMRKKNDIDDRAYKTYRFSVYRFNFSQRKWNDVECLGDRALFVGRGTSFSLRACDYPGLRPNAIYFADHYAAYMKVKELFKYGGHDVGVFNLEDNSIEHYYPFGQLERILPPPIWVAPSNPHSSNDA